VELCHELKVVGLSKEARDVGRDRVEQVGELIGALLALQVLQVVAGGGNLELAQSAAQATRHQGRLVLLEHDAAPVVHDVADALEGRSIESAFDAR
jgi:hypothetical protein